MRVIEGVREMQQAAEEARCAGRRLALVPTMGALHEGHLALVAEARRRADHVTVSIYVNPTQFGPNEDFERYPRTVEADLNALRGVGGVDAVFVPSNEALYPAGAVTWVKIEELDRELCGRYRPVHFLGVTTVVAKLFVACRPHVAVFGKKDAQQYLILKRMTRDLGFDTEILGVDTVREPDGLALSSRNRYLDAEERRQAVVVSRAVSEAAERVRQGEQQSEALVEAMRSIIAGAPLARPQYVQVVDTERLQPVDVIRPGAEVLVAVAVYFGQTRLIDNAFARAPL